MNAFIMNENWFRPAFHRMDAAGKQALMEHAI